MSTALKLGFAEEEEKKEDIFIKQTSGHKGCQNIPESLQCIPVHEEMLSGAFGSLSCDPKHPRGIKYLCHELTVMRGMFFLP